ncbi:MAG: ParB N-terminal domain-containing protein, partial [Cyanobacteriota bacterium]|nr:ParB N-terminal domain-containing protein [Cyanobacteriota bacterium]
FTQPLIVDEELTILAGHARYEAAKRLNLPSIPCRILPDLSDEEKAAYVIADNKIADESSWDMESLIPELGKIADLGLDEDFASILAPSAFGIPDSDLSAQYKPVLDPVQGAGMGVTDEAVAKEKERLASQFEEGEGQALVRLTCPHCDESFVIEKRIVA